MAVRSLYIRIYLTVVAVVLVFAIIAGLIVRRHADAEYTRIEHAIQERTQAMAEFLARNMPPATASDEEQKAALLDWSRRLRLTVALVAADGHRIAETPEFYHFEDRASTEQGLPGLPDGPSRGVTLQTVRVSVDGGRTLIVGKVRVRPRFLGPDVTRNDPSTLEKGPGGPHDEDARPERAPEEEADAASHPSKLHDLDGHHGPHGLNGPQEFRKPHHHHDRPSDDDWLDNAWQNLSTWFRDLRLPGTSGGLPHWVDEGGVLLLPFVLLFLAIAVGSYPVVRRLTRRLETLKRGVDVFGAGDLSHRVDVAGNDEVAAVASSFNEAAGRIEELVRANQSLLANASHELRSPLARLKMAVAMMQSADDGRRQSLKQEIDRDIRELDALVEEVLLASRLDSRSHIAHDHVDLVGVAADEASRIGAGLSLLGRESDMSLQGDERLLRRAIRNLLENARRYGGDDVELELRLRAPTPRSPKVTRTDSGRTIEIVVRDRGPGVPVDQRERIFEPFYRMPGHSEREGGVGLGLSLVRQIAERHGGQVRCESRQGGGSEFILSVASPR